jgi:hypothetical protein
MKGANVMKTLTQTTEPITDGQKKLITRMIGDVAGSDLVQEALDALSKKGAERLKGNPAFVESLRQFAVEKISEFAVVNEFANEEVESKYGYLSGYKKSTDLNAQCNQLRILFPGIGFANQDLQARIEKGEVKLPANAEGWFAIPNWKKNPKIFGSTYSEAVVKVLDAIKKARDGAFYNYRNGQVDEQHLRQSARSIQFWDELAKAQGDADILIIDAQFGIRHRGRSVRRARVVMEDTPGEVGLGAFVVGIMPLTNPIRLKHYDDLWIDCAGDEWSPDADGAFSRSPCFIFNGGLVRFDANDVDVANGDYGTASGFPPQ